MAENKSYPKLLIYAVAAMIILGIMALLVVSQANKSRELIPVYGRLGEFQFTAAHDGQPFGTRQMSGKINVVDFIFTSCKTACPVMAENMVDLYDYYRDFDQVQFVSISVDPERDTIERLKMYAREHGVTDNRWVFLHAPVEDVVKLCEEQFMLPADELPMGHTTKFIVVDHLGQIRSYHEGLDSDSMASLKDNIRQLAKAMQ